MVGLPCSGKTTLARQLEKECSAVRLSQDEWHLQFFGMDAEQPAHSAWYEKLEAMLWGHAARPLMLGTNVIWGFGFWGREEREDFRSRAKQLGASRDVRFRDVHEEGLSRRLAERDLQPWRGAFPIPEELTKAWIWLLQRPIPDELVHRESQPGRITRKVTLQLDQGGTLQLSCYPPRLFISF